MWEMTNDKLAEAQFFLRRLSEESARPIASEGRAANYLFNALLCSAASVEDVLEHEDNRKYAWFPTWLAALSSDDRGFWKQVGFQRVLAVHHEGVQSTTVMEPVSREDMIRAERGVHPAHLSHAFLPPGVSEPTRLRPVVYVDPAVPRTSGGPSAPERGSLVAVGERYVQLVARMVADFQSAHAT